MRKKLIKTSKDGRLSVRKKCALLDISRSGFYYKPKGESVENIEMMHLMDKHIQEEPTAGVITMQMMLREEGFKAGYERTRRLMRLAGIMPIYPRRHLTVLGEKKYVYPYLLNSLSITKSNQVWTIDITYKGASRNHLEKPMERYKRAA